MSASARLGPPAGPADDGEGGVEHRDAEDEERDDQRGEEEVGPPVEIELVWPTTDMVDAAIKRPSSMAPASPMKIRAGWKLWGRNPTQSPMMITEKSGPELSGPMVPRWTSWWE